VDADLLSRVLEILGTVPEIYLPVERLWLTLRSEGLALDLDLPSFQRELEADSRFEFSAPPVLLSAGEAAGLSRGAGASCRARGTAPAGPGGRVSAGRGGLRLPRAAVNARSIAEKSNATR
jgi:hypothetical protein